MQTINLAGLNVSAINKKTFLDELSKRISQNQKSFVITPYSEFLYEGFRKPSVLPILNSADFSLADGIGMLWAATFFQLPFQSKSYSGRIIEALWQAFYTLLAVIFNPAYLKRHIPEKIVGADLIWDLAELAEQKKWSIYLLGGFDDTAEKAIAKLRAKFPNLKVAGLSSKNPSDDSIITDINAAKPDMLLVAFGPIKQEQWIYENLPNLETKMAIGLGGTFDYLAGKYKAPPSFLRNLGLEWLWRLITQPRRWKRIYNATVGLVVGSIRYKVFHSLPMRPNVVIVILNRNQEVLVCERNPHNSYIDIIESQYTLEKPGYWQLPQGGINSNEDIISAAQREAKEEVGLKNLELIRVSEKTNSYTWNNAQRKLLKNGAHRNVGQEQKIVYFAFSGSDEEIKIDNHEFINSKWVKVKDLQNIIHPERAALTKIIMEELA